MACCHGWWHSSKNMALSYILTVMLGGNPPKTSPSPPVLLHGPTSAPTKTNLVPCPHLITPLCLEISVLSPCFFKCLSAALALVFNWSTLTLFKDLSPLCLYVVNQKVCFRFSFPIWSSSCPRCDLWASSYEVRSSNWGHWLFFICEQRNSSFQQAKKLAALLWLELITSRFSRPEASLPLIHATFSKFGGPCFLLR